ncbi:MAG: zinc ribbon domain-containing protein [Schaedlerella sp.]|nr:zinc ribbon domain-containing protein [Schaedlerella sp.]
MSMLDNFYDETMNLDQDDNNLEISRIENLIAEEKDRLDDTYCEIGKLYVSIHKNDNEELFSELLKDLSKTEKTIKNYLGQIAELRGLSLCEKCGAEVPKEAAFCGVCGEKMPMKQTENLAENQIQCMNCGKILEKGVNFCIFCGTPVNVTEEPAFITEEPAFITEEPEIPQEKICSKCGFKNEVDSLFCTECGNRLND